MREIRRPAALLAVGAALAMPLAACGDDEEDSGEETTAAATETATEAAPTAPAGKTRTVSVSETDFALAPKDLTVKAGTTVTFEVTNHGGTDHNLEVEGPEGEAELAEDLAPGGKGTLEVTFTRPGSYEWYCPVGNHKEMGMEGTITVK